MDKERKQMEKERIYGIEVVKELEYQLENFTKPIRKLGKEEQEVKEQVHAIILKQMQEVLTRLQDEVKTEQRRQVLVETQLRAQAEAVQIILSLRLRQL